MVSASCSTTMTLLPRSRSRRSVEMRRRLSRWCRPIEGSSSTYITPDSSEPSCEASRMRCASPPASVAAVPPLPRHGHAPLPRAVQDDLALPRRERLPGAIEGDSQLLLQGADDLAGPALLLARAIAPGLDGAAGDGQLGVRHDQLRVDLQ